MFQGQAFQSNAFQAGTEGGGGPAFPDLSWSTGSPFPLRRAVLSTALAVSIGLVQTPFVEAAPAEDVTCDKWLNYSVTPPKAPPRTRGTSWVGPELADVVTANLDKWLTDSPDPAPAKPRPPSSFAEPVLADVTTANLDKWFTDSPRAPLAKPRPPSVSIEPLGNIGTTIPWLTESPDPAPARLPQNIGEFSWSTFTPAAPAEEVTLDKWLSYSVGPFPTPRRPESVFAWSTFTPAQAEEVTLDKWLSYSVGPFPTARRTQSVFIAPVFFDETSLDKWFSYSLDPVRRRTLRQQSDSVAPPFVVEVLDPLAWNTDSPQGLRLSRGGVLVRQAGAFAWSNFTPAAAPEGFIGPDKWLPSYPYPRLQGNKAGRVDIFSVFTTPDREPDPNPPVTDFFTVSGESVSDRFVSELRVSGQHGISWPWGVKKRTQ